MKARKGYIRPARLAILSAALWTFLLSATGPVFGYVWCMDESEPCLKCVPDPDGDCDPLWGAPGTAGLVITSGHCDDCIDIPIDFFLLPGQEESRPDEPDEFPVVHGHLLIERTSVPNLSARRFPHSPKREINPALTFLRIIVLRL